MIEYASVSFYFNQDEYETHVATGHVMRNIFVLPDGKETMVMITLDSQYGIESIETVTKSQLAAYQDAGEDVSVENAVKIEGVSVFCLGFPPVFEYEIKLKNGNIISAEPRLIYGSLQWVDRYNVNKTIPSIDVKGWRIKKKH